MTTIMNESDADAEYNQPPSLLNYNFTGIIAVLAVLANTFILIVFCSNKRLLASSALLVGLTIGHVINGVTHSIVGFWPQVYDGQVATAVQCVKAIWVNVYIAIYQLLPILLALNATERLLALAAPVWYRSHCKSGRLWYVTGGTLGFGVVLTIFNALKGWISSGPLISADCIPPQIVGMPYMIYCVHIPAVLGGISSVICTGVGVHIGRRRIAKMPTNSNSEIRRAERQLRLTKCLLLISGMDVVCVVIPNIILILFNTGIINFPTRYVIYPVIVYDSDSVWNIFSFVLFNTEFRKVAKKLIQCKKEEDGMLFISASGSRFSRGATVRPTSEQPRNSPM